MAADVSDFHILLESNNVERQAADHAGSPLAHQQRASNGYTVYLTPDLPYISVRARARAREEASERAFASVLAARLDPRRIDRGNNDRMERTMGARAHGRKPVLLSRAHRASAFGLSRLGRGDP